MSSNNNPEQMIAAYVPVIHEGYIQLFDRYPDATIGVFDADLTSSFDYLRKDIRALSPENAVRAVGGLGRYATLLSEGRLLDTVFENETHVVMPDDDLSRQLIDRYNFPLNKFTLEPVFLRWDRQNVQVNVDVTPDSTLEARDISDAVLYQLQEQASKSTNWWRHIGAVITQQDEVLGSAHNQTLPTDYTLYTDGDPRITSKRGENIETSIDIHAESKAIADMAREGVKLEGASIYVTTFPCPNCAKLIAVSGIKTCYFVEGYAMLDGYSVLKDAGVDIIKINAPIDGDSSTLVLPYPSN